MANKILAEHEDSLAMTITLASLADGSARQTDMVTNTDDAQLVRIYFEITTGTTPTVNTSIEFYELNGDIPSNIRTDNAGPTDAGITVETASLIFVVQIDATSDKPYRGSFLMRNPGPEWGIAIKNNTGVALNSTGANHKVRYIRENQEVQ